LFQASLGYIDPEYKKIKFDLNGDGVVNSADKDLDLPRAAKLTYNFGLVHEAQLTGWKMSSRVSYAYRDSSAYTDTNLGTIPEQEILDAGIDFLSTDGAWVFGIYGKNLLDEVKFGGDTQLPTTLQGVPLGGTFSPLAKGRQYGLEVTYNFK
jgi:iron complex outermembrane receptor protein